MQYVSMCVSRQSRHACLDLAVGRHPGAASRTVLVRTLPLTAVVLQHQCKMHTCASTLRHQLCGCMVLPSCIRVCCMHAVFLASAATTITCLNACRSLSQLLQLDLTGNPVQQSKAYQLNICSALSQLQRLDGQVLCRPGSTDGTLLPAVMRAGASQWHSDTGTWISI